MVRNLAALAAWATFCFICFVTLSPIDLRPPTGSIGHDRFFACFLLGLLLVLAYPHRFLRLAAFVAVAIFGLETLQHLTPDRHGQLADAIEKVAGGLAGCSIAKFVHILIGNVRTN